MSLVNRLGSFPLLTTERLQLREIAPEKDASLHYRIWSDASVMEWLPHLPSASVEASQRDCQRLHDCFYDESYVLAWAIALKDTDEFIGGIRFHQWSGHEFRIGELGYELSSPYWNQGLMTEALQAACQFGFDRLGLVRVQLTCRVDNAGSRRVAVKAGFQEEGTLRSWGFNKRTQQWYDQVMYSRLRSDQPAV